MCIRDSNKITNQSFNWAWRRSLPILLTYSLLLFSIPSSLSLFLLPLVSALWTWRRTRTERTAWTWTGAGAGRRTISILFMPSITTSIVFFASSYIFTGFWPFSSLSFPFRLCLLSFLSSNIITLPRKVSFFSTFITFYSSFWTFIVEEGWFGSFLFN